MPEKPGAFKKFLRADRQPQRHRVQLPLRRHRSEAHVYVGVQVADRKESLKLVESLQKHGYPTLDLTDDEMAKNHIRHMVGGHAPAVCDKGLKADLPLRIPRAAGRPDELPDPDAAPAGTSASSTTATTAPTTAACWSACRCRRARMSAFKGFLKNLGYAHWDESENPAYKLFLG